MARRRAVSALCRAVLPKWRENGMNESGTIKSFDGLKLFFQKQGCGPAVLMVHGACVDSDCFEPLAALLEKKHTVYRYDRAGYGRSESRENGDSLLANARDLLEILRQIDPPVRVIAHSAGGAVAMKLAEIQPNAMAALLVFEPHSALYRSICPINKQKNQCFLFFQKIHI